MRRDVLETGEKEVRRAERLAERVARFGPVAGARAVFATYGDAGGGLLAGGLAYSTLFTLLPALLLIVGLAGLVITDPARRDALVTDLTTHFPPLEPVVRGGLSAVAQGSVSFSLFGLAGLAWAASRFYASLDEALARIFSGAPQRGTLDRVLRGFVTVGMLVAAGAVSILAGAAASFLSFGQLGSGSLGPVTIDLGPLSSAVSQTTRTTSQVLSPAISAVFAALAAAVVYRVVPNRRLSWRMIAPAAVLVGIALSLLTDLFAYVAPRLVGSLAIFGGFITLFAAMAWLSTAWQILLIGAAWVRVRAGPLEPAATARPSDSAEDDPADSAATATDAAPAAEGGAPAPAAEGTPAAPAAEPKAAAAAPDDAPPD